MDEDLAGSSTPIARVDEDGDSYQVRRLKDGSTREVLENFPGEGELEELVAAVGGGSGQLRQWEYCWCLEYRISRFPSPFAS